MFSKTGPASVVCVFSSYAQEDSALLAALEKHMSPLRRQGLIKHWHYRNISAGSDWKKSIDEYLSQCDIILLLISADFVASDYCYGVEMIRALEQYEAGKAVVLPIFLRPALWRNLPFAKLQGLPRGDKEIIKPVTLWRNRDLAFLRIVEELSEVIEAIIARSLAAAPSGVIVVPQRENVPQLWNVTSPRNPYFTAREHTITYLHDKFTSARSTTSVIQAVTGPAGSGKTQIAIEYAYRYKDDYQAVFWLQADSREHAISEFLKLADLLALPEKHDVEQGVVIAAIKRWFQGDARWLLIFDNLKDMQVLRELAPEGRHGDILVTSRSQVSGDIMTASLELGALTHDEGARLLVRRFRKIADDASLQSVSKATMTRARQISELLDDHPLALEQAGAYIAATRSSLSNYLRIYRERRSLQPRAALIEDQPISVAVTFLLCWQNVKNTHPGAANVLQLCAFLHADAIPEELFIEDQAEQGTLAGRVASNTPKPMLAIKELLKYALVRYSSDNRTFAIHPSLQNVLRDGMQEAEQRQWAEQVVRRVNGIFPEVDFEVWQLCQRYLPHALVCGELIKQWSLVFPEAADLLNKTGAYLYACAQYTGAQSLHEQALMIYERIFGTEHLSTANTLNYLGELARKQGHYAEAEKLFARVLLIREHTLGIADSAQTLNDLGVLAQTQDQYARAENLYQRALTMREQTLGRADPATIGNLSNLAGIYDAQGNYDDAERYYEQARELCQLALQPEHPTAIRTLGNLARFYRVRGKYAQSAELFEQVLPAAQRTFGKEHPEVATLLNNYGLLCRQLKKYAQAEQLFTRAINIWVKVFGETHQHTGASYYNLARIYDEQDDYARAEPRYQQALAAYQQNFGPDHPATRAVLESYNAMLRRMKRDEAR